MTGLVSRNQVLRLYQEDPVSVFGDLLISHQEPFPNLQVT
jgi:hypothetical protein